MSLHIDLQELRKPRSGPLHPRSHPLPSPGPAPQHVLLHQPWSECTCNHTHVFTLSNAPECAPLGSPTPPVIPVPPGVCCIALTAVSIEGSPLLASQAAAAPWSLFRKCSQPCFLLINNNLAQRPGPRGECSPHSCCHWRCSGGSQMDPGGTR